MQRTIVLDTVDQPEATVALGPGAELTWTRDPSVADVLLAHGHADRLVVVMRTLPSDGVAALLARAARAIDVHVVLVNPTPPGVRALLRLGVASVSAGADTTDAVVRGLPLSEPVPVRLHPTDPARCELRVLGRVLRVQLDPPALLVDLPVALPADALVEVTDGIAVALGQARATFRVDAPPDDDPHGADPHVWRLVPDEDGASTWDTLVAKAREGVAGVDGTGLVPGPWSPAASVTVAVAGRWCGVAPGAFEVVAHAPVRQGAVIEVVGLPPEVGAPCGVFGRVVRAEGTSSTRLRCERLPVGPAAALSRRATSVGAPVRDAVPLPSPARRVEPAVVWSAVVGVVVASGLVWLALHRRPAVAPHEEPASTREVLHAIRDAFK